MQDELLWAAAWLYKATLSSKYVQYVITNQYKVSGSVEFSWENKVAGVHVLLSKVSLKSACQVTYTSEFHLVA